MGKSVFTQRLSQALLDADMSQAELGRRTNIHKATINQYVNGHYKPGSDALYMISAALGCNPMWLLGREENRDSNVPDPNAAAINLTIPIIGGELDKYGNLLYNDIRGYMLCEQEYRDRAHFFYRMTDDSMAPMIQKDDILLCRMSRQLEPGDIGLFVIDRSEVWIRQYGERDGSIVLECINRYWWPPRVFSEEEKNRITVEAKVILCTHKFE